MSKEDIVYNRVGEVFELVKMINSEPLDSISFLSYPMMFFCMIQHIVNNDRVPLFSVLAEMNCILIIIDTDNLFIPGIEH